MLQETQHDHIGRDPGPQLAGHLGCGNLGHRDVIQTIGVDLGLVDQFGVDDQRAAGRRRPRYLSRADWDIATRISTRRPRAN